MVHIITQASTVSIKTPSLSAHLIPSEVLSKALHDRWDVTDTMFADLTHSASDLWTLECMTVHFKSAFICPYSKLKLTRGILEQNKQKKKTTVTKS